MFLDILHEYNTYFQHTSELKIDFSQTLIQIYIRRIICCKNKIYFIHARKHITVCDTVMYHLPAVNLEIFWRG